MSKFPSGIFSKARGKLSGVVFSAARTRKGKLMTARQLVIPANPQTTSQQSNRSIFTFVQDGVRSFGPSVYRDIFNRGVEDLPGYQSLLSLFRRSYTKHASTVWRATVNNPDTLLGDLHFPDSVTFVSLSGNYLEIDWSTELGDNGSADDEVHLIAMDYQVDTGDDETWGYASGSAVRSDGNIEIERSDPGGGTSWEVGARYCLVFFSPDNPEGERRSLARWFLELE